MNALRPKMALGGVKSRHCQRRVPPRGSWEKRICCLAPSRFWRLPSSPSLLAPSIFKASDSSLSLSYFKLLCH